MKLSAASPVIRVIFLYDITCETMIDEFILFIFKQPFLKCQHAPVLFKIEHINQCIEIKPGVAIRSSVISGRVLKLKSSHNPYGSAGNQVVILVRPALQPVRLDLHEERYRTRSWIHYIYREVLGRPAEV
jgi:hypothetical protein